MKRTFSISNGISALASIVTLGIALIASAQVKAGFAGVWEFNNAANIGQATIGTNLTIVGTAPTFVASQSFSGLTLNGVIQTTPGVANHLLATHGIAPNGGGTRVNQYSMLFDMRRPNTNEWRTLFQSDTSNTSDGDYFVRDSDARLGVGALTYTPTYQMPSDQWVRLVITADLTAAGSYRAYVDGTLVHTHTQPALDSDRFSLLPTVLLFGDENNENNLLSIGAVAIWDQALTAVEVGGLGIAGAPIVAIPEPSSLLAVCSVVLVSVAWRIGKRRQHSA